MIRAIRCYYWNLISGCRGWEKEVCVLCRRRRSVGRGTRFEDGRYERSAVFCIQRKHIRTLCAYDFFFFTPYVYYCYKNKVCDVHICGRSQHAYGRRTRVRIVNSDVSDPPPCSPPTLRSRRSTVRSRPGGGRRSRGSIAFVQSHRRVVLVLTETTMMGRIKLAMDNLQPCRRCDARRWGTYVPSRPGKYRVVICPSLPTPPSNWTKIVTI